MNAKHKPLERDLSTLNRRIKITSDHLDALRAQRERLLDQADRDLPRRLEPAAQERILEDVLSAPGPLDQKLAHGMRIVHEPPDDGRDFDPDPDFAQRVADDAKQEAAEMAREQARRIRAEDEAMDDLHGGADSYCDSNGQA